MEILADNNPFDWEQMQEQIMAFVDKYWNYILIASIVLIFLIIIGMVSKND